MKKALDFVAEPLKTRPLAAFSILVCIFVIVRLFVNVEPLLFMSLILGLGLVFLYYKKKLDAFIVMFIFLATVTGVLVSNSKITAWENLSVLLNEQNVRVEGHIASMPENNKNGTNFFFDCDRIYSHKGELDDNIKLFVECDGYYRDYRYGDRLVFNARLSSVEIVKARFGKHFLSKGAPLVASNVILLEQSEARGFKGVLASVRNYIGDKGDEFFRGDTREFFKALTIGDRSGFSDKLTSDLGLSGLSHVACVSGLHVSILGMAIYNMLKRKGRYVPAIVSVLFVYAFALITGATPSTLRAAMMFTSFILAESVLMDNDSFTSLAFSAAVLMLINPYVIFDWGFILSFLSVLGIQVFSFSFKKVLSFLPDELADSISVTLSAQIMTLPAIANMFGYVSVYSVLANVVVSMIFIYVLYACFAFVFVSFVPFVNWFVSVVCAFLLDCVLVTANLFADMKMSIVRIDNFDIPEIVVYYTLILMFVFRRELSEYFISAVALLCAALLLITAYFPIEICRKYSVAESSLIVEKNNDRYLLAKDSIDEIAAEYDKWHVSYFDDVVVTEKLKRSELCTMEDKVSLLHIPEEFNGEDFILTARAMGFDIVFYNIDADEYIKTVCD